MALPENIQPVMSGEIRLEACSACQLRCPSCPTTTGHTEEVVGKSYLRIADFVRLIDDNPWIGNIELSNNGEVFLNPDLVAIFRHAYDRNVTLKIGNGANLNHVREEVLEAVVRYEIAVLRCSIDGASPETYKRYRKRGDFDRVLGNVRRLVEFKRKYNSKRPHMIWQFIAFGHNEHEIERAAAMARDLGMQFEVKLTWDDEFSPVKDKDYIRRVTGTGAASRREYGEKNGREYLSEICQQLWVSPQVNWNGKMIGCCRNFWGDFGGNAFRDGLTEAFNHEKMAYARAMLEGTAPPRDDIPCSTCELYEGRKSRGDWFKKRPNISRIHPVPVNEAWTRLQQAELEARPDVATAWARVILQLKPGHEAALLKLALAAERAGRATAARYYREKAEAAAKQLVMEN